MSNVDSLLDLGDDPFEASSSRQDIDQFPPRQNDPFDPFGTVEEEPSGGTHFSDDFVFDPFASSPVMSSQNHTAGGEQQQQQQQQQEDSAMSNSEQKAYEDQFADLLGDLGPSGQNGVSNGLMDTGDVTTTTTEVTSDEGGVTTTTTKTVIDTSGQASPQSVEGSGGWVEQAKDGVQDGSVMSPSGSDDAFSSSSYTVSTSTSRLRQGRPSFDDTLPDYQPPKRYVKQDDTRNESKGPSVVIMDEPDLENGVSSTDAVAKDSDVKSTPAFGSLLAAWRGDSSARGGGDNMCKVCNKRVYEMEKMIADKAIYHKTCFKCSHCKRILSLGNYAAIDGNPYCKPHFIEIFKTKGKYDTFSQVLAKDSREVPSTEADENADTMRDDRDQEETMPKLSNIKSRFESVEEASPPAPVSRKVTTTSVTSSSVFSEEDGADVSHGNDERQDVTREVIGEKEEVRFTQLSSVRNMFESASSRDKNPPMPSPTRRTPAARDPQRAPAAAAPGVERVEDDGGALYSEPPQPEGEQLPPAAVTKNMVSKFRDLEYAGDGFDPHAGQARRPVHKITPPRDDLVGGIEEAQRQWEEEKGAGVERDPAVVRAEDPGEREGERPPPSFTRNMLAKFKSLEDVNAPPPSPARAQSIAEKIQASNKASARPTPTAAPTAAAAAATATSRASPDSGIMDLPDHYSGANGHEDEPDAAAAADREREDLPHQEALPEEGYTRSMLARWRDIEALKTSPVDAEGPRSKPAAPRPQQQIQAQQIQATQAARVSSTSSHPPGENGYEAEGEERWGAAGEEEQEGEGEGAEDYLPPASFTKNRLAMFQHLAAEAEREASSQRPPVKKQFKWQVKEAPHFNRPGLLWRESGSQSGEGEGEAGHQLHRDHDRDDHEVFSEGEYEHQAEEPLYQNNNAYEDHIYEEPQDVMAREVVDGREVARSDVGGDPEEELPPPAFTKNMLAKFRSMEDVSAPPPSPQRASLQQKLAYASAAVSPGAGRKSSSGSTDFQDQPLHQHQGDEDTLQGEDWVQNGGEDDQDVPAHDPDVIREGDNNQEQEIPESGTTRNLLAKFQALQTAH